MSGYIIEVRDADTGAHIATFNAGAKNFSSGSRGFHGQLKIPVGNANYQTQFQMVEIGSKNLKIDAGAAAQAARQLAQNAANLGVPVATTVAGTPAAPATLDANIVIALAGNKAALDAYVASFNAPA